jgi:hypothetical protein
LSSRWLRAVPHALFAWRVWALPVFVGVVAVACGVIAGQPSPPVLATADGGILGGGSSSSGGTNSCVPSDVLTFVQGPYRSAAPPSGACLDADGGQLWDAFYDACLFGPSKNNDQCTAFKQTPENAACAACILTPATANQLGPILSFGEFVGGNVAGCIEITTPSDPICAKAVQALSDCETAACQANCPVTDEQSLMARVQCVKVADQLGCQSFFNMASNCRADEADAGFADLCNDSTFKDFYDDVVPLFCGHVAVDAGAAPASDASAFDAEAPADAAADQSEPDAGSD